MKKDSLIKVLTLGVVVLFIEVITIRSIISVQTHCKTVITVDDELGDADYTSIKEALNHSNPLCTIEVYSGTYDEYNINITLDGISLIGMPYELGNGDDTGKPFINGHGFEEGNVLIVDAVNVTVSGFRIENLGGYMLLRVSPNADGCIISNNYFHYAWNYAISLSSNYSQITNNTIRDAGRYGIGFGLYGHNIASDNIIYNCGSGISLGWGESFTTVIRNRISNCGTGIDVGGVGNIFRFNTLENNYCGLWTYASRGCFIIQNNFFNNSIDSMFYDGMSPISGNRWLLNYWERPRLLPYPINGTIGGIFILLPCIKFDWRPALKPYDITIG